MDAGTRKNNSKILNLIVLLCCLAYFVSYITRKNYSVAISGIAESTGIAKSALGAVESALLVFYGAGQIVSGFLGDRFKPQNIVFLGLALSAVCNAIFPMFDSVYAFTAIWAVNGFAQALFWPPMVKIIADYLSPARYKLACSHISTAAQIATIGLYLLIPLILETLNYKWVFWVSAIAGAAMAAVWIFVYNIIIKKCEKYSQEKNECPAADACETPASGHEIKLAPLMMACGIVTILIGIIFQGFLRDGITTWMPDFVMSHSEMGASQSILMNVLMPVFGIAVTYLGTFIYSKCFRSELTASSVMFLLAAVLLGALFAVNHWFSAPPVISVILAALVVGLMHFTNLALISYVPARFARYGAVAFLSGLTNAFTYVGSAVSTSVTAVFSEKFGWDYALVLWLCVALAGAFVCVITVKRWKKFIDKENPTTQNSVSSQK